MQFAYLIVFWFIDIKFLFFKISIDYYFGAGDILIWLMIRGALAKDQSVKWDCSSIGVKVLVPI